MFRSSRLLSLNIRRLGTSRWYTTAGTKTLKPATLGTAQLTDFARTKVQNQQFSEYNGLPLLIGITKAASEQLKEVSKPETVLRISVESGGCHGFQYIFKLTDTSEYKPEEGDSMFVRDSAKVMMDKTSLEILRDSKVDYVHELIGSQFKVVDSPYSKSSCGCGSSFDIDFDKMHAQ